MFPNALLLILERASITPLNAHKDLTNLLMSRSGSECPLPADASAHYLQSPQPRSEDCFIAESETVAAVQARG